MQRLKIVRVSISEVFPGNEYNAYSEAGKVRKIQDHFSHLPHPLIVTLAGEEIILEYPDSGTL